MPLWINKHKKILSIVVIIIFIGFIIGNYCLHHKRKEDYKIANNFNLLLVAMSRNDLVTVKTQANKLINYNNRTPYPRLAALFLAKLAILDNDLEQAEKYLTLITKQNNKDQIWHIANLRLLKILLLQNKLTEVNAIKYNIQDKIPQSFLSKYQELFGDFKIENVMEINN